MTVCPSVAPGLSRSSPLGSPLVSVRSVGYGGSRRPTRHAQGARAARRRGYLVCIQPLAAKHVSIIPSPGPLLAKAYARLLNPAPICWRSEEHTSELQSLMRISYAVFFL